jgi:hypothetical protein
LRLKVIYWSNAVDPLLTPPEQFLRSTLSSRWPGKFSSLVSVMGLRRSHAA